MFSAPFVGALDAGTQSVRFIIFDKKGEFVTDHQLECPLIQPRPGWGEHDPTHTIALVRTCMEKAVEKCSSKVKNFTPQQISSVGITNHRESVYVWDRQGRPLSNAILWLDNRTSGTCAELEKKYGSKDHFRPICGLPFSTYFSAVKFKWLLDNDPQIRAACEAVHITDVTNASRTMLMSLNTLQWDSTVCQELQIPMGVLPSIKSSAETYGLIAEGVLKGVPISGCLGDQQASLVGNRCFEMGMAKNTYGTGCFLLVNTGCDPIPSTHGLLTTVGYQLGPGKPVFYALEGSVAAAGLAVRFLVRNLGLASSAREIDELAAHVEDSGDVYFVPAFGGLLAPRWRPDARGVLVGITQSTTKEHIARAALDASCYQTAEVLEAVAEDIHAHTDTKSFGLTRLSVDGGMTKSVPLLQMQADVLGIPVDRPAMAEVTALGAAYAAGLASGVWKDTEDVVNMAEHSVCQSIHPTSSVAQRTTMMQRWKQAVERSLNWAD